MREKENIIGSFNHFALLLATMVIIMNIKPTTSTIVLLASVVILPVVFACVVGASRDNWHFAKMTTRASALGAVLTVMNIFVAIRVIAGYQGDGTLPPWIHIMALSYVLLYWDSFFIMRAVRLCYIAWLKQRVCVEKIRHVLMSDMARTLRIVFGDYLDYEEEYLAKHANIARTQKEKADALISGPAFARWIAKRFEWDYEAAAQFLAEQERENPQI